MQGPEQPIITGASGWCCLCLITVIKGQVMETKSAITQCHCASVYVLYVSVEIQVGPKEFCQEFTLWSTENCQGLNHPFYQ